VILKARTSSSGDISTYIGDASATNPLPVDRERIVWMQAGMASRSADSRAATWAAAFVI